MWKRINYYTLREGFDKFPGVWKDGFLIGKVNSGDLSFLINQITSFTVSTDREFMSESITETMFFQYLLPYHIREIAIRTENELSQDDVKEWFLTFMSIVKRTFSKYDILISGLENKKNDLLGQIGSTTQFKYNDTPQNAGNWNDDNHVSNQTETTVKIDGDTAINRLAEVERKLKDYYTEWSKEFTGLFIDSAEIDD